MRHTLHVIGTSIVQALNELRVNKLRTFLSLLGVTIGIFCIIAVTTVIDSMKRNIQTEMNSLGSDVLYINRWPWMDEGGEYKWWEFLRRPSMSPTELRAVDELPNVAYATLSLQQGGITVKRHDQEVKDIATYAVTQGFDKMQNIEIQDGRYLSLSELQGGGNSIILGYEIYKILFPGGLSAVGKTVAMQGRQFTVAGVMKPVGENMAGFDFDNSVIYPYYTAAAIVDVKSLNMDPVLMVKVAQGINVDEVRYEVEGALRRVRRVEPGEKNDFAINQLSQVSERLDMMFGMMNGVGYVIGGFSLLVAIFGIANIMFVTVKERTRVIGLKKAIGAKQNSILLEFLIEAITLCIVGGLIGIVIVLLLSVILTNFADFPVTLSLKNFITGITISAVVGVIAGFIPARAAARLDPVVAIRSH